ncbi:MAG TPA: bifunctional hydroxymethylpyrimidine kinase/phosphomethylpyrimidine kinase [Candidatus Dormibacteraeota bacterium]|nr:bifunctional hydroxymethylpyrimidine kinase/phosphomethylpyrimidine kinase [Candidatus Dormibacteraeota bacterium]
MSDGPTPRPIAATIATTDSGGGAGIQADLKTFAACGVYGVCVAVALTAQNTLQVRSILPLPLEFVHDQFEVLDPDLRPAATKTGMLLSAAHIEQVCVELSRRRWGPLVVDPVMVAKSGHRLLEASAVATMRSQLLPLALVVTPNWPEAAVLSGRSVASEAEALLAGRAIAALGVEYVVVKGGHSPGQPVDLVVHRGEVTRLPGTRVETRHTHGTGCTFSAAITAFLARGLDPLSAITKAKGYVAAAIAAAPGLGAGHGPLQHFPDGWPEAGDSA